MLMRKNCMIIWECKKKTAETARKKVIYFYFKKIDWARLKKKTGKLKFNLKNGFWKGNSSFFIRLFYFVIKIKAKKQFLSWT